MRYQSSPGANLLSWIQRLLFLSGAFLLLTLMTPLVVRWSSALARPWEEASAGTLITFSGPGSDSQGMLGESSYWRSVYAARAWRMGHFDRILILGGPSAAEMALLIVASGVPAERVTVLDQSSGTHGAALTVAAMAPQLTMPLSVLTSDFHILRAGSSFRKAGMHPTMVPFPDGNKRGQWPSWYKRPGVLTDLVEETVELLRYRWNGWI
jgi:uncharacterized SAM-binding protein YcdF (DUF218 family)